MEMELAQRLELMLTDLPTRAAVEALCRRAKDENVRGVVVPSSAVLTAQHFLEDSPVRISCRVGSPFGAADSDVKRYETELAVDAGAHEIEIVPSLARLSDGDFRGVLRELRDVVEAADERPVKVAAEPSRWTNEVLRELVQVVLDSGAQFLCADEPDQLPLLREWCGPEFSIVAYVEEFNDVSGLFEIGASFVAIPA